jgi:rubrerythrin
MATTITLTPTKDKGAQTKPNLGLYLEPAQELTDDALTQLMPDSGLNVAFLADVLSGMLTHERCGTHLYRAVSGRSNNPMLKRKYEEFGEETATHVEILESLITQMGGNPNYVSPTARAVEGQNTKLLESTYTTSGSIDPMTAEMAMLDAVFLAESMDHANWKTLGSLVELMPAGELRDAFEAAVARVEAQEDDHLGWATTTKQRLIAMQVKSEFMTTMGMKAEELVARVRNWFSE